MKSVKKGLLVASAVASVCGSFCLVACGDPDPVKPPAGTLSVPAGVRVVADSSKLEWLAVTGATSGYTVKINSDETTKVDTNELDLTTVVTLLVDGDNTLQVKANAADGKKESAYSAAVTYEYHASGEFTPFDAPTVTLTGDTLSWNAVTGATSGYTVKINTDETTVVTTTSLDLTTVTAKLISGENSLAVKVNGVDGGKPQSEYSQAQTYVYTPSVEAEAADYKALVSAIGAITADSTAAQAASVKAAITAAQNKYAGMSEGAKALEEVIADKAIFDSKKEAFDGVYDPAKAAYDEFAEALGLATEELTKQESLSALTAAKATADEKKGALNGLANSMITTEQTTAYAALVTAVTEWTTAISEAKTVFAYAFTFTDSSVDLTTDGYAACEADIAAVNALLTAYDGYPSYIQSNLVEEKETLESGVALRNGYVDDAIAALISEVKGALDSTTPNASNYASLQAIKNKLDSITLGAYGAAKYAEDYVSFASSKTAVAGAMDAMLHTPVGEPAVSANASVNGDSRKLFIAVSFKNFRGDVIAVDSALPQISVEFEKSDPNSGSNVTIVQQLTKNTSDDNYVAVISMYGVGGLTSASYTIGDGAAIDIDVTPVLGNNPYFSTIGSQFKDAFNSEIILLEKAGFLEAYTDGKVYLEMYEEGSIEADNEGYVRFVGQPIGERIDVTAWTAAKEQKIAEFERFLALNYSDYFIDNTRSVHFVIYGEATTDGNTVPSRTAVQLDTVSNPREFKLTEYDKYYHFSNDILESGIDSNGDVLSLFTPGRINGLAEEINDKMGGEIVTVDNIASYMRVKVETLVDGKVIFTTYAPFVFRGYTLAQLVADCSEIYYVEQGNSDDRSYENISVRVSFDWSDAATAEMKNAFKGGATMTVALTDDQKTLTLSRAPYTVPSTVMNINNGGDAFEFFRNEKDGAGNAVAGYVMNSGNVKYAKLDFYRTNDTSKTVKFTAYIHNVDGNAKLSLDEVFNSENPVLGMDIITNSWINVNQFKEWFTLTANVKVDGYALRWDDGWSVSAQYVRSADSDYLFDGTPNTVKISDAVEATDIPNAPQMGFDGVGNATFVRAFGSYKNGEIFTSGAAKEVEIHFYQGDTETTDHKLSLRYDNETGECKLYDGDTAVSDALAGGVGDLWCDGTTLDGAVRAYLKAKKVENADDFTYTDGWKFYTVIIARDGNVIWTGEKGALSDTVSYTAA